MKLSTLLKWLTGGCEAFLAIPIAGGAFIFSNAWMPLLFMFVFHLISLVVAARDKRSYAGNILGMITSAIGAIPFIGWVMHTVTAIVLLIEAGRSTSLDNKS